MECFDQFLVSYMITKFSVSLEPVAIYIVSYISIPGSWRKFDQLSAA